MDNPELFYLAEDEYRQQTLCPQLVEPLTDSAVDALLLEVMSAIDAYIGSGYTPYDDDQEFIFPRDKDIDASKEPFIIRPVSLATRILADALMQKRAYGVLPHEVASESNIGHEYTLKKTTTDIEPQFAWFPPEAITLLMPLRNVGGYFSLQY